MPDKSLATTRRKLFGWMAATPFMGGFAVTALADIAPEKPQEAPLPTMEGFYCKAFASVGEPVPLGYVVAVQMIYDGSRFVLLDSPIGKKLLQFNRPGHFKRISEG